MPSKQSFTALQAREYGKYPGLSPRLSPYLRIMEVNVHEAKTNFSKLLQRVILGDEIIIAKAGVPVAKLVRFVANKRKRPLGLYRGQIWMSEDFNAPLPEDILADFYGESLPPAKHPSKTEPSPSARRRKKR